MRATLRKSGAKRFTMHVTFTVGREDLGTLLALEEIAEERWSTATRGELLTAMRRHLKLGGPWTCGSLDDIPDERIERAFEAVDRLFPELASEVGGAR